ncbi:MazF family transcriptional regulator [Thiomonas sp. X19]|uniref:type II toxin-antitoxin system PemK/MazF family toxin n=1 Tax=Thiomonas sp. X19 TaxID=1050370 RepID=UPI000B763F5A|nr:type II toxin-antitoxin system PemK/MazF family toxin [Thiomonas sp. X19]SCC93056.1 MazF family transcriptional regulator [Thiomonas sp. X19]
MGSLAAGQVVVLPFPFSDLSRNKYRPALVLADTGRGDWIACQITSNPYADPRALALTAQDFDHGSLAHMSYVRPGKLFTAHEDLIDHSVGTVNLDFLQKAREAVILVIRG